MSAATSSQPALPGWILLVDDSLHGCTARRRVLEEQGYHIQCAATSDEALLLLQQRRFDLLITDYRLPNLDGIALVQQARAAQADVRCVLLSGIVDALGLDEASTGADMVIQKSATEVSQLVRAAS